MSSYRSLGEIEDAISGDASIASDGGGGSSDDTKRSASLQAVAQGSTARGDLNKTEQRWAARLELSEHVAEWQYEELGFRYGADDSTHWPDFVVFRPDGRMEIHEVKGYVKDAGRLRFLSCADRHPQFRWIMVVQDSKTAPWRCKYDTAGSDGKPYFSDD